MTTAVERRSGPISALARVAVAMTEPPLYADIDATTTSTPRGDAIIHRIHQRVLEHIAALSVRPG